MRGPEGGSGIEAAVLQSVERLASTKHQPAKGQAAQGAKKAAEQSAAQYQAAAVADKKDTKTYNKHHLSVLKGFCRVTTVAGVPQIWGFFQKALGTESHRDNIAVMTKAWARAHGEQIDVGVFYTKSQLKDMQNMCFNPGASSTTYKSAEKMISILACCSWAANDIEELKELEEAAVATEGTRMLIEQLKLALSNPCPPVENFLELWLNIATFAALL